MEEDKTVPIKEVTLLLEKYDLISFIDLHIFIPKGNKRYSIEKIKKLLDIYDEYVYQIEKIEQKNIISDEEKKSTKEFIESVRRQKEAEIGTFIEDKKI